MHLISVTKLPKRGTNSKKRDVIVFCLIEYKYATYFLNQHRQLTNGRNVCGTIFC